MTTGYSFTSGEQNITHTKLNAAVNSAVINPGFLSDKSALTTFTGAELLLIHSGTSLYRTTLDALLYDNIGIITNQTVDATPNSADSILTFDISAGNLKQATLLKAVFENDALINARTNNNTPGGDDFVLTLSGSTWWKVARSNLWYQFWNYRTADFTNLAPQSTLTNLDTFVIFSGPGGSNRTLTVAALLTNAPVASALTNTDSFLFWSTGTNAANLYGTNPTPATVTLATLANSVNNLIPALSLWFTSGESNLVQGSVCDVAHGLGATPGLVRWVLVCKTNDLTGHVPGDEVDLTGTASIAAGQAVPSWGAGANTTNVFLTSLVDPASTFRLFNKTNGALTAGTATRWRAKAYARP